LISFRFHLVSLTAIFLALALGIVLGTTVVERATVSVLESRIKSVRADAEQARTERDSLIGRLRNAGRYDAEIESQILAGRLDATRVLVISADGVGGDALGALQADLNAAGAIDAGLITLTDAWNKSDFKTRSTLADAIGVGIAAAVDLRTQAASKLAVEFAAGGGPSLRKLVEAGLARSSVADMEAVPGPDARVLIVGARPGNAMAEPLARALGVGMPNRTVVAETGPDDGAELAVIGGLRKQRGPAQLSTVDNVDKTTGRVATVFALAALARGTTGDFGTADGADRTVPAHT